MNEYASPRAAAHGMFPQDVSQVGSGAVVDRAPFVTIAIGLEFALCATWPAAHGGVIHSDVGEAVLHSHEADESAVLDVLRRRHGQLCGAQVLCEGGIVEIHRAVCLLRGVHPWRATPSQIVLAAMRGESPECARTLAMFCGLLGDVAGRAALTLAASGGVFLAGPVVARLGDWLARSPFRRRFEGAGRLVDTLRAIPTFVAPGVPSAAPLRLVREDRPPRDLRHR